MNAPASPFGHLSSIERVVELHGASIEAYGGLHNAPKDGCIESALGNAWTAEGYREKNEYDVDGLTFASSLLLYLAIAHCFGDGNKCVAWAALCDVLLKLGLTLDVGDDEAESFVLQVATGATRDRGEVIDWVADRLAALPEATST